MTKTSFGRLVLAAAVAATVTALAPVAQASEGTIPPRLSWSFSGPFGKFDQAQLQRGFKVYREVCSACHSLHRVTFRNLSEPGGPEFSEGQVKALAAEYKIQNETPNDQGDMFERPGRPADRFPLVYPNDNAARAANNGAVPPDMSLLAKARGVSPGFPGFILDIFRQYQEGGPDYIHALIAEGYGEAPKEHTVPEKLHYNKFFPGNNIAMAKPIADGQVEYTDGSPQTVDQYLRDVSAFLMWASEPSLEARKETGFKVIIFLIVFAGLLYATKKRVWRAVEAH